MCFGSQTSPGRNKLPPCLFRRNQTTPLHKCIKSLRTETHDDRNTSRCPASMTVEAALVLPLFLFFLMGILFVLDLQHLQGTMLSALHEAGTQLAEDAFFYRYGTELLGGDAEGDEAAAGAAVDAAVSIFSVFYVSEKVQETLDKDPVAVYCLDGGRGAISYLQSSLLTGNDDISLTADYAGKPFIRMLGFLSIPLQTRFVAHAWVGYDPATGHGGGEGSTAGTVYVTKYGSVYHRDRGCIYLNPQIRTVTYEEALAARSADGSKYYPCETCRPGAGGMVYLTKEGDRYHSSLDCGGLTRTIREYSPDTLPDHLHACPKCGGE